jgi:hypothetical protein
MSKKRGEFRQFHVNFWQASAVESMDPVEKLLYVYMISSPKSNMEGVYKTTLRRISFETGIDRDMILKISERLESVKVGGIVKSEAGDYWVIVSHAPEFMTASESIQTYFAKNIEEVPSEVVQEMHRVGYRWPEWAEIPENAGGGYTVGTPSPQGGYTVGTHVSDTDTDTDTNTDTNTYAPTAEATASRDVSDIRTNIPDKTGKPVNALKDPIAAMWEHALTEMQPSSTWGNYGKERSQCKQLAQRTRDLIEQTPYTDTESLITAVMSEYDRLKRSARTDFWKSAPWTPSALIARWSAVWDSLSKQHATEEALVF